MCKSPNFLCRIPHFCASATLCAKPVVPMVVVLMRVNTGDSGALAMLYPFQVVTLPKSKSYATGAPLRNDAMVSDGRGGRQRGRVQRSAHHGRQSCPPGRTPAASGSRATDGGNGRGRSTHFRASGSRVRRAPCRCCAWYSRRAMGRRHSSPQASRRTGHQRGTGGVSAVPC
jgi:hypothetical protein